MQPVRSRATGRLVLLAHEAALDARFAVAAKGDERTRDGDILRAVALSACDRDDLNFDGVQLALDSFGRLLEVLRGIAFVEHRVIAVLKFLDLRRLRVGEHRLDWTQTAHACR